jgi:hypothetical protein
LKTDVNGPTESNKEKKLEKTSYLLVFWKSLTKRAGSESVNQVYGSKDPDPEQNVTGLKQCTTPIKIHENRSQETKDYRTNSDPQRQRTMLNRITD